MKQIGAQIVIGILLCVSTGYLSQAAATIGRIQTRMDRLESKVDAHWEYLTIHQITKEKLP